MRRFDICNILPAHNIVCQPLKRIFTTVLPASVSPYRLSRSSIITSSYVSFWVETSDLDQSEGCCPKCHPSQRVRFGRFHEGHHFLVCPGHSMAPLGASLFQSSRRDSSSLRRNFLRNSNLSSLHFVCRAHVEV